MSDATNSSTPETLSQLVRESQKLSARVLEMLLQHQAQGSPQPVYESNLRIDGRNGDGYFVTVRIQDLKVEPLPVPDYDDDGDDA